MTKDAAVHKALESTSSLNRLPQLGGQSVALQSL